MNILDLGCGFAKVKGAIGIDKAPLAGVDMVAELNRYPYPLADNCFDEVYLNDVIEHLPDTITTMEEIYRICKPGGKVFIRVINWNSHYNAMDPTHVRTFTENSFDFFGKFKDRTYYSTARFDVVNVGYKYNATAKRHFRSKRLLKFLSHYLNNVLEDLNFELQAVKKNVKKEEVLKNNAKVLDVARCPNCSGRDTRGKNGGKMKLYNSDWLVCLDCDRKYPVYEKLPMLTVSEGDKWAKTKTKDLPKLDKLKRIKIGD